MLTCVNIRKAVGKHFIIVVLQNRTGLYFSQRYVGKVAIDA